VSGTTAAPPEVAFVVQRYGEGITGGSESLARAVAERLAGEHRITVFTTCARDYVTWRNELPEGRESLGGVDVLRFPVAEERDLAAFNAFAEPLYVRERSHEEEVEFLRRQGPHAPSLVESLAAQKDRFAAVVFFTYLYAPTYWGLRAAPERSALVPTTHDEPPLRFSIYREAFARPRAFAFLTPAGACSLTYDQGDIPTTYGDRTTPTTYTFTAVAKDDLNAVRTSAPVTVTVIFVDSRWSFASDTLTVMTCAPGVRAMTLHQEPLGSQGPVHAYR